MIFTTITEAVEHCQNNNSEHVVLANKEFANVIEKKQNGELVKHEIYEDAIQMWNDAGGRIFFDESCLLDSDFREYLPRMFEIWEDLQKGEVIKEHGNKILVHTQTGQRLFEVFGEEGQTFEEFVKDDDIQSPTPGFCMWTHGWKY